MSTSTRHTSIRRSLVVAISMVLSLAFATSASAGTLDQEQTTSANNQLGIGDGNEYAQTFTAGRTGLLDQIDLLALRGGVTPTSPPLLVQVRMLTDGTPDGPVLASETLDKSDLPPTYGLVQIRFTSPASVVAGRQYAIVLSGAPAGVRNSNYGLAVTMIDAYPGGEVWSRSSTGTWQVYGAFMRDWWFRTYVAPWTFSGFLPPVEDATSGSVNHVKAGASVPVKFSLAGDKGLDVIQAGYPKLEPTPCEATAEVGPVEETRTANTGLTYDPATDIYTYVWKTQKRWAGTCGTLRLQLNDGSTHTADFNFK